MVVLLFSAAGAMTLPLVTPKWGDAWSEQVVCSIQLNHQLCGMMYHLDPTRRKLFSRLMKRLKHQHAFEKYKSRTTQNHSKMTSTRNFVKTNSVSEPENYLDFIKNARETRLKIKILTFELIKKEVTVIVE